MNAYDCLLSSSVAPSVRQMNFHDVPSVVQVHMKSFSGFFLSFLGPAFLRELYAATMADHSGIGFVAENEGSICGFVTGTAQPSGFYGRLLRQRWWRFALASLLPLARQPSIAPRLLRAFSKPGEVVQKTGRGTLMSVAVLPEMKRVGIGKSLVQAFLKEAYERSLRQVDLTTDSENNNLVNNFYLKLGFICERKFITPEGRAMNEYVIDLLG